MSNPQKSPQESRRLKTRAALMSAGARLLAERPIDAIPISDIADAAGVAKGSFFNHFVDKDDLAVAIAAEIRAEVECRVTGANAGVTDSPVRIARAVAGFVQFARIDPIRARIMLRGHDWTAIADHPLNHGIPADIAAGQTAGRLRPGSLAAMVIFVAGSCHMLLVAAVSDPLALPQVRQLTADLIGLVLSGLGLPEPEATAIAAAAVAEVVMD